MYEDLPSAARPYAVAKWPGSLPPVASGRSTGCRRWRCATSTSSARARTRAPSTPPSCRTSWPRRCRASAPTIYGDGEQARDFTYVGDVVQANLARRRLHAGIAGEVFNVACGDRITVNGLIGASCEIAGARSPSTTRLRARATSRSRTRTFQAARAARVRPARGPARRPAPHLRPLPVGPDGHPTDPRAPALGRRGELTMKVGVVGLGYVGLPLAVAFAEAGYDVIGVDIDARKIAALDDGRVLHRGHPVDARCGRARALSLREPRATPTSREARRGPHLRPDAADAQPRARPRAAVSSARARSPACCSAGQLVVLESTTYPGHDARAPRAAARGVRPARRATTSTSRSRPSASIRAAPTTRCATRRRSSAASPRRARSAPSSSTGASATTSCPCPPPRSPS